MYLKHKQFPDDLDIQSLKLVKKLTDLMSILLVKLMALKMLRIIIPKQVASNL
jgi:hypothetical protein